MRIEKAPKEVPVAEQVAAILGVPSETVMVREGPDGVEVEICLMETRKIAHKGKNPKIKSSNVVVVGEVPDEKKDYVEAWARRRLGG